MRFPSAIMIASTVAFAMAKVSAITFPSWQSAVFTSAELADPAVSGAEADPDGDGRSNLLEYALGLDPVGFDADPVSSSFGASGLTLLYPEVVGATDLLYYLTESPDLQHWITPNASTRTVLSEDGTQRQIALFNSAAPASPPRWFSRLRVILQPDGTEPLFVPTRLSGTLEAPFAISLGWNDNARVETGYLVEKNSGGGFVEVAELEADENHWRDADIEGSTTYTYRVSALRGFLASAPSEEFTLTTPLDSDGDGLSDEAELNTYSTDPFDPDSDNDGMADGWEVRHGLNPRSDLSGVTDATGDLDDDGLSNFWEYTLNLDPLEADSDHNGVPDVLEDADGDGLPNGWEASQGTNPTEPDADRDEEPDGLTNAEELEIGTLPFSAYSDNDTKMDGEEGFPTIGAISDYPRVPVCQYAVIDLGLRSTRVAVGLNNNGKVLASDGAIWSGGTWGPAHAAGHQYTAIDFNDADVILSNRVTGWVSKTYRDEDGVETTGYEHHTWAWIGETCLFGPFDNSDTDQVLDNSDSTGRAINNAGVAIGQMSSPRPYESGDAFRGALDKIPTFGADAVDDSPSAEAISINDAGIIVGYSPIAGQEPVETRLRGFYLDGSALRNLGENFPIAVNSKNDVLLGNLGDFTRETPILKLYRGGTQETVNLLADRNLAHLAASLSASQQHFNDRGEMLLFDRHRNESVLVRNNSLRSLQDLVGSNLWSAIRERDLNNSGIILAVATKAGAEHNVILLPIDIDSDRATIQPKYRDSPSNPYLCNNINHIAAGEKIEGALTIYHKAVRNEEGETEDFDVILKIPPIENITWTKTAGPDSGELVDSNSPTAIFRNPTKGGLYEFELSIGEQAASGKLQLWLPVAGPDISSYWESEIAYFKNSWGPAYRAKLNDRTVPLALNPPARWMLKKELAFFDMLSIGWKLDWNGEILGEETPCGGPISTPGNRLTLHKFVISWSKRNNMMYALIGREMGLPEMTLISGGHAANLISTTLRGNPQLDSPETVQSYRAGFDLFNGVSLEDVMKSRGLKMHQPDGWDQWEWPSHETSEEELQRMAEQELQELIE